MGKGDLGNTFHGDLGVKRMIDIKYMRYIKYMIDIKCLHKIYIQIDNKMFPLCHSGHHILSQFSWKTPSFVKGGIFPPKIAVSRACRAEAAFSV